MRACVGRTRLSAIVAAVAVLLPLSLASPAKAAGPCGPPVTSVIACENSQPGDPPSDWQVNGSGDSSIQGFATSMSANVGQTIQFKIKTAASSFHIDILRLGYYQGNGARKIASGIRPSATLPQSQPACLTNASTGLIDCGNWAVSASWAVPASAVSGLYEAHLVRDDTGGSSQILFVVRNDASTSDILLQTSDETWEAYNDYGGNSLYTCTSPLCPPGSPGGYKGAFKVSYNRPFDFTADQSRANPFYAEYPMIRFLEANGYDVTYTSSADVDRNGPVLLNHKLFISSGHDEYWSKNQRANVQAARDGGVNLAFFSGNEVFWKTRWEPSTDGSNTQYRTLVSYKETHFDAPTDPQDPPTWTGTWEDPRFSPPADGGLPPNQLTGQNFLVNSGTSNIQVPAQYAKLRIWRNTQAAKLTSNQTLTLGNGAGTLGYEWDEDADNGFRPSGTFDLSSTTVSGVQPFLDYGTTTGSGSETHHLTLYRASSGALVFGAGTVQWSWGLDSTNPSAVAPDVNMQQATVNLLADMGPQPASLMSGLTTATPSSDTTPPASTITFPAAGANLSDGSAVTITGTATEAGGGVVAGVEVSTDRGNTWHPATITSPDGSSVSWSYSWLARGYPSAAIESRAVDDSGNIEIPSNPVSVNVACPCSIWGTGMTPSNQETSLDSADPNGIEVGVKFKSDAFGTVSGVRFYKVSANTGTHFGDLWTSSGQLLARATFTGETASGWQQVTFSSPVVINPNTTYIASYYAPAGHYSQTEDYFYPAPAPAPHGGGWVDSPPLHALTNTGSTTNSVYTYTSSPAFPTNTFTAENYWVDPVFTPSPAPGQVVGVTASAGYASATVSWTAPSTGGPATTYTVTPWVGSTAQPSTTVSGSPASTSTTVTGLTNGTTYTFTVQASNPNGSGAPSAQSAPVTPLSTLSVVFNGGFEAGISAWQTGGVAPPVAGSAQLHSGAGSALLGVTSGTEPSGDSSLSQMVQVPAGTSTFTFWYWPASTDSICSGAACQYDWQEAQIRTTAGATLASVFKSNSNAQTWTKVTFDASAFAGQTVVLWFNVHEDGSSPPDDTWMYLDDVALQGSATPPASPAGVTATAGDGQATVRWSAPANGGSPITAYTVTPYVGGVAQPGLARTVTGSPPATTAPVPGLTNGTTYTFSVKATNAIGVGAESAQSNPVVPSAPTAPGIPANVTATAGNQQVVVGWTAPATGGSPLTSYTVTPYVNGTAQIFLVQTVTGSPPATTATVTGLTNGTTYTFTVTATNAIGTGPESNQSNAATPATVPTAPTAVTPTAGNAQASVSWVAPSDGGSALTSYTVTPYVNGVAQTGLAKTVTGSPPTTTATVTGLTNGTAYTFTVHAANAMGAGAESAPSSAVTPATVPGAPSGVSASAGNAQATVAWTPPGNGGSAITSYTITPYINGTAQPSLAAVVQAPATNGIVPGLANGTTYTFTVRATNSAGPGPESAQSSAVTPSAPTAPGAPSGVTATAGDGQATVRWSAPANGGSPITAYTVTPYVGGVAQPGLARTVTGSPPATTAPVPGLTNGTTYTFTVKATNAIGVGAESAQSNPVVPSAPTAPGIPANVTATAGNQQVVVGWTAPATGGSPLTSYTVTPYVNGTAQIFLVQTVTGSPPATTATVTGLTNGTTYTFTVTATNAIGTGPESNQSNAATPATVPTAPTAVTPTAGNAQASVSWVAPSDGGSALTSYTVTPYVNGVAQTGLAKTVTGSPPTTTATVTGLTNGTAYTFTVHAANAMGAGAESAPSSAVTPATVPGAPSGVSASAGNAQATVAWTPPGNGGSAITSYTITPYINGTAQPSLAAVVQAPATNGIVPGLANGTTYTFTVRATNSAGPGPESAQSSAVTAGIVTPAFVQQTATHVANVTTAAVTPTGNITSGNRLVVIVGIWNNSGPTAKSVTDSAGNTYTEILHFKASDKTEMSVWTSPITSGGGTRPTITVTPTARADVGVAALEYSGLSPATGTGAIDQTAQNTGKTSAAASVSSGATPATTAANELAMGFYVDSGFADSLTRGGGFTARSNVSNVSDMEILAEDQLVGQGGTPNGSVGTGASTVWLMSTVVFKHG